MKKLLLSIAFLAFLQKSYGHCYPSYMWSGTATTVGPGTISTSYTGNKNFHSSGSATAVFGPGTNFNSWTRLNFEEKIRVNVPINFPAGKAEIGLYGTNTLSEVSMDGADIIYAEGTTTITKLISNNSKVGQWNIIYTDSKVWIGDAATGKYYKPKDTFYSTPGNPETAVIITDCYGTSLPLTILSFSGQVKGNQIEVRWKVAEETPIKIHYSADGTNWKMLSENAQSPYIISDVSGMNFVKISSIDNYYSETLRFKIEGLQVEGIIKYFDFQGRELPAPPTGIPYMIVHISPLGITSEKKFIIN